MNTGMQDAINLAWKLALVARGRAAPLLLDSYSPERSAVGEMVLKNAARLTRMGTLGSPAAQFLRNTAIQAFLGFEAVQDGMAAAMSETDIAYLRSPLSHGRHAGRRMEPHDYDGPPPGAGEEPCFVLFAADAEKGRALAARYPALVDAAPRRSPNRDTLLVVRPDGYVGFEGRADDWAAAGDYLERLRPH